MAGPNHSPAPEGSDRQMARSRISQGRLTPCQRVVGFNSIFQPYEDRNRREKPDDVAAMKLMCAWSECEAVFKDPMPADWRSLLVGVSAKQYSKIQCLQIGAHCSSFGVRIRLATRSSERLLNGQLVIVTPCFVRCTRGCLRGRSKI